MFKTFDDGLVCDEHATIELWNKEGQELSACLHDISLVVFVAENVVKVSNHRLEKLLNELITKSRLELQKEVISIDQLLVVVSQRLLNVNLDLIVKDLWQRLAHSWIVQFDKPNVDLITLGFNDIDVTLGWQETIHSAHDDREDKNSNELNDHSVDILFFCSSINVSIADSSQRCNHPIQRGDINRDAIGYSMATLTVRVWQPSFWNARIVKPRAPVFSLTYVDPTTSYHVHNREQDNELAENWLDVRLGLLWNVATWDHWVNYTAQDVDTSWKVVCT